MSLSYSNTIEGLEILRSSTDQLYRVAKYVGEPNIPSDIARQRRYNFEIMRRMGQPVIIKPMYTDDDVRLGRAEKSDNFNSVYGQVRNHDPLSHGVGFVSIERSENEWIDPASGAVVVSDTQPTENHDPAPKYRGFGPGHLTYVIEPDKAEDYYKESPTGVLIKVQEATAQTPWFPDIDDNDLFVNVTIDAQGRIVAGGERYQAKMVNPISIRGLDRRGRREYSGDWGNRFVVEQQFEMALLPSNHVLQEVEIDR